MARPKRGGARNTPKKLEEEIDYAAVADALANGHSGSEDDESEPDDQVDKVEYDEQSEEEGESSEESQDSGPENDDDSASNDDHGGNENDEPRPHIELTPPTSATGEQCTFDLRNLLAINSHQVNSSLLYKKRKAKDTGDELHLTIPPSSDRMEVVVNEDYLLEKATDGCTQLIAALWQLPMTKSDAGPMATLPPFDESRIPRALPPPPPKKETAWEKFAKEKGIPLNKKKRSQKVWDEATGTWMFRHGYNKANDDSKEWPIMEVKGNEDPYEDPWERQREAKRSRVEKNTENQMRNLERSGQLAKGTTTRLLKSREKSRQAGKAGGNMDRDNGVAKIGIPVDLKKTKGSDDTTGTHKRGKESTLAALAATQRSTASLGKFDKVREGEPDRKKVLAKMVKKSKRGDSNKTPMIRTSSTSTAEADRNLKIFKSVMDGGGVAKERAIKKGKFAKGETAFDYDYDDGLGASTFRKKKGRAGAGKAKKMTKKRSK